LVGLAANLRQNEGNAPGGLGIVPPEAFNCNGLAESNNPSPEEQFCNLALRP
jgi:hypothetical protein